MQPIKVRISKNNTNSEIIIISENEANVRDYLKIISNFTLTETDISFPEFTKNEIENFKKNI